MAKSARARRFAMAVVLLALASRAFVTRGAERTEAEQPPPSWRPNFDKVYRLGDDEVVKLVPEPFIPERTDFLLWRGVVSPTYVPHLSRAQCVFHWDGKAADYWSLAH